MSFLVSFALDLCFCLSDFHCTSDFLHLSLYLSLWLCAPACTFVCVSLFLWLLITFEVLMAKLFSRLPRYHRSTGVDRVYEYHVGDVTVVVWVDAAHYLIHLQPSHHLSSHSRGQYHHRKTVPHGGGGLMSLIMDSIVIVKLYHMVEVG